MLRLDDFSSRCSSLLPLLLFGLMGTGAWYNPASAQTPVTNIKNGNGDLRLELNHNGSLYLPGNRITDGTANDSIPAIGAGTRMMWYPAKAAFRAGRVFDNGSGVLIDGSNFWDASQVGNYSIASGRNTKASGAASVALGSGSVASALTSTAMGMRSTASSAQSFAVGFASSAEGPSSMALGSLTSATSHASFAANYFTTADNKQATAFGLGTVAGTRNSFSLGECNNSNTSADGTLLAVGNGNFGDGENCSSTSDALALDANGNMVIAGSLTETSDRRLKTDIQKLGSVLDDLKTIDPVRFHFKEDTGHPQDRQIGLIAQEVQKNFPELVSKGSDGYLSLAYPKLTGVLLKGLQEQQSAIAELKTKNRQLRSSHETTQEKVTALEKRLARVESQIGADRPATAGFGTPWSVGGLLLVFLAGGMAGAVLHRSSTRE